MLSPMFNPQEFFLPEELLPPKKRGRDRSSSSTSALPQVFEMGESSHKIEGLGKGRVIIQQDFDNLETELQEARIQITKLQRKQMGNNNKIALARFRIANLEQIIKDIQNALPKGTSHLKPTSHASGCHQKTSCSMTVVSAALKAQAATMARPDYDALVLSWWNSFAQPIGIEEAYKIT
ncbi:hypothetical protein Tco_1492214 [Tanacetum coccineum]